MDQKAVGYDKIKRDSVAHIHDEMLYQPRDWNKCCS